MAAKTDAREEAVRHAKEDARVVLAKHPCVTAGDARRTGKTGEPLGSRLSCDQILGAYERQDIGRGQDVAGTGSSK